MTRSPLRLLIVTLLASTATAIAHAQTYDTLPIETAPTASGPVQLGAPIEQGPVAPTYIEAAPVYSAPVNSAPVDGGDVAPHEFIHVARGAAPYFEVSASLLYLQPSSGNLEYATLVSPLPLPSPNWQNQTLSTDLSPAFNFGIRYAVPETGNDIQFSWTHLDADADATVLADPDQFVGPSYEIGPDASGFSTALGRVNFEYDAINLDAGQYLTGRGPAQVRVFAGLQYAHITQDLFAQFTSANGLNSDSNATTSEFNGAGPRLGFQAECLAGRWDFLGQFAAAALIGRMQSRIDFSASSPLQTPLGIPNPNPQFLTSPESTQVIPALDTKLGLGYTFAGREYGRFRVEGGYQAGVYFNAINEYVVSDVVLAPVDQSVGVFLRTAERLQNPFTVHGPYASLSWMF